jgi:osmoprotectant transport system permease protein
VDALQTWLTYVNNNRSFVIEAILQHTQMVLIVVVAATLTAIVLGVLVQNRPVLKAAVLAITGIFLTIPSLALFALFIPLVGIGNPPAMLALYLYALLPVLRNTVAGLESVNPAVVESAKGMGMTGFEQLVRVRLPLAWPIVMAGVRISTLLTSPRSSVATASASTSSRASPGWAFPMPSSRSGSASSSPSPSASCSTPS